MPGQRTREPDRTPRSRDTVVGRSPLPAVDRQPMAAEPEVELRPEPEPVLAPVPLELVQQPAAEPAAPEAEQRLKAKRRLPCRNMPIPA